VKSQLLDLHAKGKSLTPAIMFEATTQTDLRRPPSIEAFRQASVSFVNTPRVVVCQDPNGSLNLQSAHKSDRNATRQTFLLFQEAVRDQIKAIPNPTTNQVQGGRELLAHIERHYLHARDVTPVFIKDTLADLAKLKSIQTNASQRDIPVDKIDTRPYSDPSELGAGGFNTVYTAQRDGQTKVLKPIGQVNTTPFRKGFPYAANLRVDPDAAHAPLRNVAASQVATKIGWDYPVKSEIGIMEDPRDPNQEKLALVMEKAKVDKKEYGDRERIPTRKADLIKDLRKQIKKACPHYSDAKIDGLVKDRVRDLAGCEISTDMLGRMYKTPIKHNAVRLKERIQDLDQAEQQEMVAKVYDDAAGMTLFNMIILNGDMHTGNASWSITGTGKETKVTGKIYDLDATFSPLTLPETIQPMAEDQFMSLNDIAETLRNRGGLDPRVEQLFQRQDFSNRMLKHLAKQDQYIGRNVRPLPPRISQARFDQLQEAAENLQDLENDPNCWAIYQLGPEQVAKTKERLTGLIQYYSFRGR